MKEAEASGKLLMAYRLSCLLIAIKQGDKLRRKGNSQSLWLHMDGKKKKCHFGYNQVVLNIK